MIDETPISQYSFEGYGIELRPVRHDDIELLRQWRNSDRVREQMHDQSIISSEQQEAWFLAIQHRFHEAYWVVYCQGVPTGMLCIKGKEKLGSESEVDVGMYTGTPPSPVKHSLLGFAMALMQMSIVFDTLALGSISMEVKASNENALKFNRLLGYREQGTSNEFVRMRITAEEFIKGKKRLSRYFPEQTVTMRKA